MFNHRSSVSAIVQHNRRLLNIAPALWVLMALSGCESSKTEALEIISSNSVSLRAGEPVESLPVLNSEIQAVADSALTELTITPALPEGLAFDQATGRISGISNAPAETTDYSIQLTNGTTQKSYVISLAIDRALPAAFSWLYPGFNAEVAVANAQIPVRMTIAPDGRLFYAELQTGRIRVVHPDTGLASAPFAELAVTTGSEKGILGLALHPQFADNGYVYVHATVASPTDDSTDVAQIIRLSAVDNRGVNPTVLVDNLPAADLHNGGDVIFDHHGHLFVGRGDITTPSRAQTSGDTAGKVLRYTSDGSIPTDNPFPGDPEWARGLRNTFALAIHPETGVLFGADAGPADNDKLNYLAAGKNFLWGLDEEPQGSGVGFSIRIWPEVITPTALHFHSGNGGFDAFEHQLFLTSYNDEDIRVLHLTGESSTDFVREQPFASFQSDDFNNKPLHMTETEDGTLYVSTFDTIYRIVASQY